MSHESPSVQEELVRVLSAGCTTYKLVFDKYLFPEIKLLKKLYNYEQH